MEDKIVKIEEEIKILYCNACDNKEQRELLRGFWLHHIVPVVDLSKEMAQKYGSEMDVVWLGALLHDFALISGSEPHDELGAIMVKDFLLARGFKEHFSQKVANIVLTHRCKLFMPETMEQKIVATADAVSHFLPNFYLGLMVLSSNDYQDMKNCGIDKLERDYANKIFFEDEKKLLRERMNDFRKWFVYKTE